jgi:hypothetical protein
LGGGQISDPPSGATLSEFGRRFAEAVKIAGLSASANINIDDPKALRDELFAFTGNTASLDGVGNNVGNTLVSDWLQQKMASVFDYYNNFRTSQDEAAKLAIVDSVLTEIYPSTFPVYKNSFNNAGTYRLWAIKPACVEAWTPECSNLATQLTSSTSYRMTAFAPANQVFAHREFNAGVAPDRISSRRTIQEYDALAVSNPSNQTTQNIAPTRMSDVVAENEGFVGSFRTVYIEPLGLASNVLATEAQAVPRATISSTVFGKLTTIIDQNGFLKDVNQITFESGFGTKILGNNTTGSLTFSVTGLTLGSLEDVSVVGASGGDILVYDAELAKWVNRPFADVVQPFLAGFTGFTGGVAGTNFFYQDSAPDAGITIGSRWMNSNTGIEYIYISDGDSFQWIQSSVDVTAETPTFTYNTTLVTGSEYAALDTDYYIGVSYAGPVLIQLPSEPDQGKTVIVKDASGFASYENRKITVVGATGSDTIDNEASAIINVNNGALQFIYKNGWRII